MTKKHEIHSYLGYKYDVLPHEAEWSEDAVKYYIYDSHEQIIKRDECESHLVHKFVHEDINKIILTKNAHI